MGKDVSVKIISSLEKIYHGDKTPENSLSHFSMLKNEKKSFQIVIDSKKEFDAEIRIDTKMDTVSLFSVEYIKSDFPMNKNHADDYYRYSEDGYYPDLLLPLSDTYHFNKGISVIWVEIVANETNIGDNSLEISILENEKIVAETSLNVEIINCNLDFENFIYTCWFHTDCLMSYYKFDAFSEEYWRVVENFLKTATDYGMNCVLTPVFTPPLDTAINSERPTVQLVDVVFENDKYSFNFDKLTKWIDMAKKCGIEYFEISHFFTQWGAHCAPKIMATVNGEFKRIFGWETKASSSEYKRFLTDFSIEFKKYIESKNLKDRILLHVSDEPNFAVFRSYSKASKLIHKLFKGYKIIDALSDVWFYKLGIVTNPVPSNDHIDKFLGKVNELWTYYCSAQNKKYVSNRFFCNSSLRTRVLGYQLYKYNIKGFLHWGYNFYYTQLSKVLIDPFKVSDAGGKFPSGDSYIVYPAKDGTAYHSIRLKVFYDALQDLAALNTLEKLTKREECLRIIEENGNYSITFSEYPHSDDWLLSTREKINYEIKENIE